MRLVFEVLMLAALLWIQIQRNDAQDQAHILEKLNTMCEENLEAERARECPKPPPCPPCPPAVIEYKPPDEVTVVSNCDEPCHCWNDDD